MPFPTGREKVSAKTKPGKKVIIRLVPPPPTRERLKRKRSADLQHHRARTSREKTIKHGRAG